MLCMSSRRTALVLRLQLYCHRLQLACQVCHVLSELFFSFPSRPALSKMADYCFDAGLIFLHSRLAVLNSAIV